MLKSELNYMVSHAQRCGQKYFAVVVRNGEGETEVIINTMKNMYKKLEYYNRAYDGTMCHYADSSIRIIAAVYADSFEAIESVVDRMMEVNK